MKNYKLLNIGFRGFTPPPLKCMVGTGVDCITNCITRFCPLILFIYRYLCVLFNAFNALALLSHCFRGATIVYLTLYKSGYLFRALIRCVISTKMISQEKFLRLINTRNFDNFFISKR